MCNNLWTLCSAVTAFCCGPSSPGRSRMKVSVPQRCLVHVHSSISLTRVCPLDALSSLVRFRIPQGDRPDLESIDHRGVKGLDDMMELMTECWHQDPSRRPSFLGETRTPSLHDDPPPHALTSPSRAFRLCSCD